MTHSAPNVLERFLRYVQFDTQSDETSAAAPSTAKQLKLAEARRQIGRRTPVFDNLIEHLSGPGFRGIHGPAVTQREVVGRDIVWSKNILLQFCSERITKPDERWLGVVPNGRKVNRTQNKAR